jgi:hypothetical protein
MAEQALVAGGTQPPARLRRRVQARISGKVLLAAAAAALPHRCALRLFHLGERSVHVSTPSAPKHLQLISRNMLPFLIVGTWSFFTNHARVLICVARDPGVRLRDLAVTLGITERSAYGIVSDLVVAGYVVKGKDGRRNRYTVQAQLPLPESISRERTIGEVLSLLVDADASRRPTSRTKEHHAH